jgi:mevalonate kinase
MPLILNMVKVSAPGKVHLIGEHAVVYGEPAIVAAIGKRVFVEAEKSDKVKIKFNWGDGVYEDETTVEEARKIGREAQRLWEEGKEKGDFSEIFDYGKGEKFGWVSIGYLMERLGIDSGVSVNIDQQIPLSAGVGSSSAYCVAAAMAFAKLFEKDSSLEAVNKIAFEMEGFKHGTPSGGDNSTCCYGRILWFQKNIDGGPNTIKPLTEGIPKLENFVLTYTIKPVKSTGELVKQVKEMDPSVRDPLVKAIGKDTHEMVEVLKARNFDRMKELINITQDNLSGLGVSIPEIDKVVDKVRSIGGAAKGCGALGGGVVLCYHEDKAKLLEALKEIGQAPIDADLAVEGVRVDE